MELNRKSWNQNTYLEFLDLLKENQDLKFRAFNQKLILQEVNMIGVRTPILRKIAKEIVKGNFESFLKCSNQCYMEGNTYFESIMIEAMVIGYLKEKQLPDREFLFTVMDDYVAKVNNWSHCDTFCSGMKIIGRHKIEFWDKIVSYVDSTEEYICRVGIVLLLNYYLEKDYLEDIFKLCDKVQRDVYYIDMAVAWLLSMCFVKHEEETREYLKKCRLSDFTYNKTLQKIVESNQVSIEKKNWARAEKKK